MSGLALRFYRLFFANVDHFSIFYNDTESVKSLPDHTFLAILDGHAGAQVSAHVSSRLTTVLQETVQWKEYEASVKATMKVSSKKSSSKNGDGEQSSLQPAYCNSPVQIQLLSAALVQAFVDMDSELRKIAGAPCGTTANCCVITPSHILCANVGDSRCVLGQNTTGTESNLESKLTCIALSEDHKPSIPEEERRVLNAGGFVEYDRVNGELAMSRALGDFQYKQTPGLPASEQAVSCYPDVAIHERKFAKSQSAGAKQPKLEKSSTKKNKKNGTADIDDLADDILILACDGVWDVVSNADSLNFLSAVLMPEDGVNMLDCAEALVHLSLSQGSTDNISAIVVNLNTRE